MPKETIVREPGQPGLEIIWGRGIPTVQVATTAESDLKLTGEPFAGWYCTLTRAEVNRLIQVLRWTRDQAFGADA